MQAPRIPRNKAGRTVKRHLRQEEINYMRNIAKSTLSKKDINTRQHLMERSFARSVRYGFGRARWRRLWRVRIQEYLTAAIQNIQILMRYGNGPRRTVSKVKESIYEKLLRSIANSERFLLKFILTLKAEVKVDYVFLD
ncbi:MAG: transposase [Thermodesulfobacteriota bacterium]